VPDFVGRREQMVDQPADDPPPSDEPPMTIFERGVQRKLCGIHSFRKQQVQKCANSR